MTHTYVAAELFQPPGESSVLQLKLLHLGGKVNRGNSDSYNILKPFQPALVCGRNAGRLATDRPLLSDKHHQKELANQPTDLAQ